MPDINQPSLTAPVFSSLWDGLSPHVIASFWPVERSGASHVWKKIDGSPTIKSPLMEANIDIPLGWISPFENAGGDKAVPGISSMLQSGAIQPWATSEKGAETLGKFEGRTGITKLNATQVFAGMQPLKITAVALFRAWRNPVSEVMVPVTQLIQWALPQELAPDGPILSLLKAAKEIASGKPLDEGAAMGLLPSIAPAKLAMRYKGMLYSPLVIESIGYPIGSPVDKNGNYVELAVPLTLCSLSAIDRADWRRAASGEGFQV